MSLNRRSAISLITLGATPVSAAVRADGDAYRNFRLGLSITKPPGWHFISLADHWAQSAEYRLALGAEARQALEHPEAVPILVVAKFKSGDDIFTPSFTVHDESADDTDESALQILNVATPGFELFAKDTAITDPPAVMSVLSADSAAACNWAYNHPVGGRLVRVDVRTVMALRGRRVQTFHFFCPQKDVSNAAAELRQVERSIAYASA